MIERKVQLSENDIEIIFAFEEETKFNFEYLEELHIGVTGMGDWIVVGYTDLQDALYQMGYDLVKHE